jgi:hypothetical protein
MKPTDNISRVIREKLNFTASAELHQRILADALAARPQSEESRSARGEPNIGRTIMKSRIAKLATAAVIVAGVFISIYYMAGNHPGSIALGEVIKEMQQVKTAIWTEVYEFFPPEDKNAYVDVLGHVAQCTYKAPGQWRLDVTSEHIRGENKHIEHRKEIQIWDFCAGKGLVLDPQKMTARPCSYEPEPGKDFLFRTFLSPKADIPPDAAPLGTKQIGNREAVGFRIRMKGDGTDFLMGDVSEIWVDAKTRRLVLAETRDAERRWVSTLKDFIFDQELDDSLFSMAPPEGYKDIGPLKFMWVEPAEGR